MENLIESMKGRPQPETKESLTEFYLQLIDLPTEELEARQEHYIALRRLIESFGITSKNGFRARTQQVTPKQWNRFQAVLEKPPTPPPPRPPRPRRVYSQPQPQRPVRYRVEFRLLDEIVQSVIMNLIANLERPGLDSEVTVHVLEYFQLIESIAWQIPLYESTLEPIKQVLEHYGWQPGGFTGPPDRKAIANTLRELITNGLSELPDLHKRVETRPEEDLIS